MPELAPVEYEPRRSLRDGHEGHEEFFVFFVSAVRLSWLTK